MSELAPSASRNSVDDSGLMELLDEIRERLQAGEPVDVQAYAEAHPEYAERLEQLLPAMRVMASLGESGASVPPSESDTDFIPGVLGDFRILREIGRGGMGVVYEAEQISLRRRVALKILPFAGALDARRLQRFQNEAQAAACLHHTNIVPVFGIGCERSVHFYAMQYIEGQTLAAVIRELRRNTGLAGKDEDEPVESAAPSKPANAPAKNEACTVPYVPHAEAPRAAAADTTPRAGLSTETSIQTRDYFRTVATLGIQAAEALEHAHETGVVHRDIKPANLMINSRGKLWITDFGLASCEHQAGLTMTGDLLGTLRYMSPEQALANRVTVDQRTDIYSLGVTLYELLTLEAPFGGRNRQELLRQIAFEEPRPPRRLNKAIPQELEIIILKAMEKNPADRYASAKGMADDLRHWLEDRPIRARRPSLLHRARKVARRHPGVLVTASIAGVTALMLGIAGLAASNYFIRQEQIRTQNALGAEAEQREIAEAALDFVTNKVFVAARPETAEGGLGHHVTLRRAIKKALPFVEGSFKDKPLIEARLRETMGQTFRFLGERETAAEQFQSAMTICSKCLGSDHPSTLRIMNSLAMYNVRGRRLWGWYRFRSFRRQQHHQHARVLQRCQRGAAILRQPDNGR
jgi:eukaryotic-like serine/threonine-protein kinase